MENKTFNISYTTYKTLEDLPSIDQDLCHQAVSALDTSYSPYSKFRVGCAIRLEDNTIELGSNQENVAYPSGLCAERVVLFSIGAKNPGAKIKSMAITAHTDQFQIVSPVTSCGACLQVMAEFEKKQNSPIEVLFYCINGEIIKVPSILSLLPFAFFENRLEKKV